MSSATKGNASAAGTTKALKITHQNILSKGMYMNNTTIISNSVITVPFHNAELYVIEHNDAPYVPMKPIVQGMGLDWKGQHAKLKNGRFNSVMEEISITAADGKNYQTSCLPLRKFPGWLMSIHPNKVKPQHREAIILYQNECDDVLWDYWNKGVAVNQRAFNRSNPQWLEVRQAGKLERQEWGDVVHDFVGYAMSQGSKSAQMYYMNITKMQYQALEFVKQSGDKYFRDSLDILQHSQLMSIEFAVQQALIEGMDMGLPYKDIFKFAKERALELAVPLKRLTGNARVLHIPVGQRIAGVLA